MREVEPPSRGECRIRNSFFPPTAVNDGVWSLRNRFFFCSLLPGYIFLFLFLFNEILLDNVSIMSPLQVLFIRKRQRITFFWGVFLFCFCFALAVLRQTRLYLT